MKTQQLEIRLPKAARPVRSRSKARSTPRASWWFDRMRQVVEAAVEWQPAAPTAEQGHLPLARSA